MIKAIYVNDSHTLVFVEGLDKHTCTQKAILMIGYCKLVYSYESKLLNNRDLRGLKEYYIKKYNSKRYYYNWLKGA